MASKRNPRACPDKGLRLSEPVVDALLGERLLKAAKRIRGGQNVSLVAQIRLDEPRATVIRERVQAWLRTGDFAPLFGLLETVPEALAHPAILSVVRRLRMLAARVEEEELQGFVLLRDDEDPLPGGTCRAAAETLKRLASAVASGLLQTGHWKVEPTKRRGRPNRSLSDHNESASMLADYEDILAYLHDRRAELRKRRNENHNRWIKRLTELGQDTWINSYMSWDLDTKASAILPHVQAARCAQEAAGRKSASASAIAYFLLGHYYRLDPRSIRHQIETARK